LAGDFAARRDFLPSFMPSCGLGGIRSIALIVRKVASSISGFGGFLMAHDEWPPEEDRTASDDYLIAFGQVTLLYNFLESQMERLFERSAPLEPKYAELLFHRLNNREKADLFSAFVRANEKDEKAKDALLECILHFDICTDNRNILMHVISDGISEATGMARFTKRASQNPTRKIEFHVPIDDLRAVADQLAQTIRFAFSLSSFLYFRHSPQNKTEETLRIGPLPLPGIPPKPRKLTPHQRPAAPKGAPLPPQPSGP
jgi:hypothetical protein